MKFKDIIANKDSRTIKELFSFVKKYKYIIITTLFLILMIFFDRHNWFEYIKLVHREYELKEKIEMYEKSVIDNEKKIELLKSNKEYLEEYAREKYYMHKPKEDIYIIEDSFFK